MLTYYLKNFSFNFLIITKLGADILLTPLFYYKIKPTSIINKFSEFVYNASYFLHI